MRDIRFRAWEPALKQMSYDPDFSGFHGLLVLEADWIPMQFTGLLDKNGKDIYEGDVLKYKDEVLKPIVAKPTGFIGLDMFSELTDPGMKHTEIIGNIYENPELLNG